MSKLYNRFQSILNKLNEGLFEREEVMNLTFLSALSGESIFLLGPPGVAKSLIARRLKFAFKEAKSFEYLMHRFSTPDEVYGPISIGKLKSEDKLERVVDHYLPGANIGFLDEIWKAGPSIQNTLLTIINEKIYRNGEQELKVDLFGLVAASNELPEKNQGLEALWDRFILRMYVGGINERENFEEMITNTENLYSDDLNDELKISKSEFYSWQDKRDLITVPKEILDLTHHIRVKISKYNQELSEIENNDLPLVYISDRRWKKIIKVLRTSAFLNGRKHVDLMDCFLIPHMLWDFKEQIKLMNDIVTDCIRFKGYSLNLDHNLIRKEIKEIEGEIEKETPVMHVKEIKVPTVIDKRFYEILGLSGHSFIRISDFNTLSEKNISSIPLYENIGRSRANYISCKIRKNGEFSVSIKDNIYHIDVSIQDVKGPIKKKPHQLLIENWNERIDSIKVKIGESFELVDEYEKNNLKQFQRNLFVDKHRAHIILEKIEELKVSMHQLIINCDELQNIYNDEEAIVIEKVKARHEDPKEDSLWRKRGAQPIY